MSQLVSSSHQTYRGRTGGERHFGSKHSMLGETLSRVLGGSQDLHVIESKSGHEVVDGSVISKSFPPTMLSKESVIVMLTVT